MPDRFDPSARASDRGGLTVVEVIVAIVVLAVGVLGLAGTAGVVLRQMTASSNQFLAATVAASRMERIRGTSCVAMRDSSGTGGGVRTGHITESWQVVATRGSHLLRVYDTVSYDLHGDVRIYTSNAVIPCAGI